MKPQNNKTRKPSDDVRGGMGVTGRRGVGHPVDVATGTLYHEFEDFVLPGRVPIVFGRCYSSALSNKIFEMI